MEKRHFTIGMAGHIDHGKTSLTKALTNIDTDRLKEEKERQITIELGFAPLPIDVEDMNVTIIDVPGHERFIRQMIAGVAGIDLVMLVVAADEGVMPQTKEHVDILSLLDIKRGIVVITKIDRVEEGFTELVEEEIKEQLVGTIFAEAPVVLVDSMQGVGIGDLKDIIKAELNQLEPRDIAGAFRLPIDQVFTVKGQGTVVRGTVYEGTVKEGDTLTILPGGLQTKARQLQVHGAFSENAVGGQRAAINLLNVTKEEVKRGNVLVSSEHFQVTNTIDVCLKVVSSLKKEIKQRMSVKCHIGTVEAMGEIVFFDRKDALQSKEEILCQIRLSEPIVARRGDRFILRRPSPVETIAGGWIIDSQGEKYRFGEKTIQSLQRKKQGTPSERMRAILATSYCLTKEELLHVASVEDEKIIEEQDFIVINDSYVTTKKVMGDVIEGIEAVLTPFHERNPMHIGMKKAEVVQSLAQTYPKILVEHALTAGEAVCIFSKKEHYLSLFNFQSHFPKQWGRRMENIVANMKQDKLTLKPWEIYVQEEKLPKKEADDLKYYLLQSTSVYVLDPIHLIHSDSVKAAVVMIQKQNLKEFELKEVKEALGITRKHLVPLMELLDHLGYTERIGDKRRLTMD